MESFDGAVGVAFQVALGVVLLYSLLGSLQRLGVQLGGEAVALPDLVGESLVEEAGVAQEPLGDGVEPCRREGPEHLES